MSNVKHSTQLRNMIRAFFAYLACVGLLTFTAYALEPVEVDISDTDVGCIDDCLEPEASEESMEEEDNTLFDGLFFC